VALKSARALIVDDEPLARQEVKHLLQPFPVVGEVQEAKNTSEAVAALTAGAFDLLFLDINMPGESGMKVAEVAAAFDDPAYVILVTAYEEFALKAFESGAEDYLLKPVPPERFGLAMARFMERHYSRALSIAPPRRTLVDLFPVRISPETIRLLPLDDIVVFQAERQYCRVYARDQSFLSCNTPLGDIEESLPSPPFVRVHRSFIVNLDKVVRVEMVGPSSYELVLNGGGMREVPVSRRSAAHVKHLLRL